MCSLKLVDIKKPFQLLLFLSFSILCVSIAHSAETTSLWKVTGDGSGPSIYLAGSIHILSEDDHPLHPAFEAAYRASDDLVLEIATNDDPGSDTLALEKGMYGKGRKISDDLSPEMYAELGKYLKGVGLPTTAMDGFRPWMAGMTISITEIMKMGGRPELGVDTFFEERAVKDGKTVRGLETTEFQIDLFAKLNKDEQEKMLGSTLKDMASVETDFPKMVKAWREGDDATVEMMIDDSMSGTPQFRKALLDNRNENWAKKINEYLKGDKDIMVIVGAAHLVGEKGLIKLLKGSGLRVERWNAENKKKKPSKKKSRFIPVSI
ncbi:MAG: TraB/GumN family protein [Verrucomicrobiota bacterium]|nr:TraB/GumN family protein [Verrucomicrobiota bacterium]